METLFKNVYEKSGWKGNETLLFWVVPAESFKEQRNIWKGSPVFADEMFQKEVCVPFVQSQL